MAQNRATSSQKSSGESFSKGTRQPKKRREAPPLRTLEPITPAFLVHQRGSHARMAIFAPALLVVIGVLLVILHTDFPVGVVVIGVVLVMLGLLWGSINFRVGSPARIVAGLPQPIDEHEGLPEFMNLLEGLCSVNGVALPRVYLIDDVALNVVVLGWDEHTSTLVFTTGLLEDCDRMELEGIIARELAQIKRGDMRDAAFAGVACGVFALISKQAARLVDGLLLPTRAAAADMGGVSITRYPPGLTRALQRFNSSSSTRPSGIARTAARLSGSSWLVSFEEAESKSPRVGQLRLDERVGLLAEL
jgi:Zn-dependent protease with chaperone function